MADKKKAQQPVDEPLTHPHQGEALNAEGELLPQADAAETPNDQAEGETPLREIIPAVDHPMLSEEAANPAPVVHQPPVLDPASPLYGTDPEAAENPLNFAPKPGQPAHTGREEDIARPEAKDEQ